MVFTQKSLQSSYKYFEFANAKEVFFEIDVLCWIVIEDKVERVYLFLLFGNY